MEVVHLWTWRTVHRLPPSYVSSRFRTSKWWATTSSRTCKCSNLCSPYCHRTPQEERQLLFATAQHSYSSAWSRQPLTTSLRIFSPKPCPNDSQKPHLSFIRSSASKTNSRWATPRPLAATTQEATQSVGKMQRRDLPRSSRPTTPPSWRICSLCATQRASIEGEEAMTMMCLCDEFLYFK